MRAIKRSLILSSIAALLVAAISVSPAAAQASATIGTIEREGCTLSIPVTVGDVVEYELQIWDDSVMIHNQLFTPAEAGEAVVLTYTLVSDVNQGAPGIGIHIRADDTPMDGLDPYDFPGSDDIARACADSGGTDSGESTTTTEVDVTTSEAPVATTIPTPAPTGGSNAPAAAAQAAQPVATTPSYTG